MHRRLVLLPVVMLCAGSVLFSAGQAQAAPRPAQRTAADTTSEQRAVLQYWTPQRMEAAQPLDTPSPRRNIRMTLDGPGEPTQGTPWAAPPATRQGAGILTQAAATAGSVWPGGGAVARTTGRVFFTHQGRTASCSGSAVTSANRSVVITAGHCVKLDGAFHSNWVFVPGYNAGNRPFGTWVATRLLTTQQWNASEDVNFDVAAAVVAPLGGRTLVDVVGGQGLAFNQARRQQMHAFGFPAAAPFDGSRLIFCSGRVFDDRVMTRDQGMTCGMTGGSSGGPWFQNFNESTGLGTQNSVNSFTYNFAPNVMFGPYFGTEAQAVYQAAQSTNAL
ncbi:peptidase [Nonomuraea sp. NPDC000554]|uniref:trypsin-like serine peptidase n=1 Tax=Nonomuraea sp. NPDC000554 TaxID=3154259 RepID=UPI00332EE491